MAIFDQFPYTNFHELNLSWLLETMKSLSDKTDLIDDAVALAEQSATNANNSAELAASYVDIIKSVCVTPEMYGAYGDGIHDDTEALQECIRSNNSVYLKGTYLITQPLVFDYVSNITFIGGVITRLQNETFNTITGYESSNIHFIYVTFEGNGNDRSMNYVWKDNVQACAIISGHCRDISFEHCEITGFNYGLYILGPDVENEPLSFDNLSIKGLIAYCSFFNCHTPIDTYGKSLNIHHNVFYGITGPVVQIEPTYNSSYPSNPLTDAVFYASAVAADISSNLFMDIANIGITIFENNTYSINIDDNTFIDYYSAIQINGPKVEGVTISNNKMIYQKLQTPAGDTRPWNMIPSIRSHKNCIVKNNYFLNAGIGIRTSGADQIIDNIFDNLSYSSIVEYAGSDTINLPTLISGNKIINYTMDNNLWYGMRGICLGYSDQTYLINNVVDSTAQPLHVQSGSKAKVINLISNIAVTATITAPTTNILNN